MRAAVLQLAGSRTATESRQVLRAAIRQLDRAGIYLEAVSAMQLDDREARRALDQLRADVAALTRFLAAQRGALKE